MGRSRQVRPERLAEKLREVRLRLGFSQTQMFERLINVKSTLHIGYIGSYETGEKVPSILILLEYARITGITMEYFADDELDLPRN